MNLGAYKKLLSANAISAALSIATVLGLLKSWGNESFGLFVFAQSIGIFSAAIANPQSWQTIVLFFSKEDLSKSDCFNFSALVDSVFSVVVFFFTVVFIKKLVPSFDIGGGDLKIFYIFAFLAIAAQNGSALGVLRFYGFYGVLSSAKVALALIRFMAAIACIVNDFDFIFMAYSWVLAELAVTVFFWVVASRQFQFIKSENNSGCDFKFDFLRATLKGWGISLIDLPVQHADKLLIGALLSPNLLAGYSVIRRIVSNIAILVEPYYQILLPFYSMAIVDGRVGDIKKISRQTSIKSTWVMFVVSVVVFALCYVIDDFVFSGVIKSNILVFAVFLIGGCFVSWYAYVHPLCYAARHFRLIFLSTLISNGALLFFLWFFSASDNLLGIAMAVALQPLFVGFWKSRVAFASL